MLAPTITTHVQDALNRFLEQYKNRPYITAIMTALVDQIQDFENAAYPVANGRYLYNGTTYPAIGAQLDGIGELLDTERNGLPDSEYLIVLLGTIGQNFSDGTWETLLSLVETLTQATTIAAFEHHPAAMAYCIQNPNPNFNFWPLVGKMIQAALGAGIDLAYVAIVPAGQTGFGFAGSNQSNVGGFAPYSTAPQTSGGVWVQPLYESTGN